MANTRAKVTKNIEIVNEIAEKFLPRLSFYHKCNKSLASFTPHALKGQKLLAQGNGHKQHALKGQKLLAQGNGHKQHALKGAEALSPGEWTQAARPEGAEALSPGEWTQAARPERAEALSPGQRPGLSCSQTCRPERAKALKNAWSFKAFALTGRLAGCLYTQGVALG